MAKTDVRIAVLNYGNGAVDIITVPKEVVKSYGGYENFLTQHCHYNESEISWMSDVESVDDTLTYESFE